MKKKNNFFERNLLPIATGLVMTVVFWVGVLIGAYSGRMSVAQELNYFAAQKYNEGFIAYHKPIIQEVVHEVPVEVIRYKTVSKVKTAACPVPACVQEAEIEAKRKKSVDNGLMDEVTDGGSAFIQ